MGPLFIAKSETAKPAETAGFKDPPDKLPEAKPPAMTHPPMARPKYCEVGTSFTVATLSTTYESKNVKKNSPARAGTVPWLFGANAHVLLFISRAYVKAAEMPPSSCTPIYWIASTAEMHSRPEHAMAVVTAGLKCAPETLPRAKIIHINAEAMEKAPAFDSPTTFRPTVRTSM